MTPLPFPDRFFSLNLRVSPDGDRLALVVRTLSDKRVFVHDLSRPGSLWPVTSAGEVDWPQWRPPSGERLAMYFPPEWPHLVWQRAEAGGTTETLIPEHFAIPSVVVPDGRYLAVWTDASDDDIMAIDVQALGSGLRPLVQVAGHKAFPEFSPDGRRLAYTSDVSGRAEVWVQPFPGPGSARMVSVDGGSNVAWNPNGRELFFVTPADASGMHRMMAVDIHPNGSSAHREPCSG